MACVHTGATVYVDDYNVRILADLYLVGDAVVARAVADEVRGARHRPEDYLLRLGAGHWFDRGQSGSTLAFARRSLLHVPAADVGRWPSI